MPRLATLLPTLMCLCPALVLGLTDSQGIDEEARLPYWQVDDSGMSLRLIQRLPDQTRGYFLARKFGASDANTIANSCVFQTVFRNLSSGTEAGPLEYDLREWRVLSDGHEQNLKLREDWAKQWQQQKIPNPAQIAFEWSLLPTWQRYNPGDYNWGMTTFNLHPGSRFDLTMTWRQAGRKKSATIHAIQCAPDIHPENTPGE